MPFEIIKHLWLGDSKDAEHVTLDTKLVVNCTHDLPFSTEDVTQIRIPVNDINDDREFAIMLNHWNSGLFLCIRDHITRGQDVLVHCHMGRQRSAATVAAFLMNNGNTKDDAINYIKSKKRDAFFPNANFDGALNMFAVRLEKAV